MKYDKKWKDGPVMKFAYFKVFNNLQHNYTTYPLTKKESQLNELFIY